jgi:hypothetical protein
MHEKLCPHTRSIYVASNGKSDPPTSFAWAELFSACMPKTNGFDLPKMEIPQSFQDFAKDSITLTKESNDKVKKTADQVNEALLTSCVTFANGAAALNNKIIESAFANSRASLGYVQKLLGVKNFTELTELSTVHVREQFDAWSEQAETIMALTKKVAIETSEPIKTSVTEPFEKTA